MVRVMWWAAPRGNDARWPLRFCAGRRRRAIQRWLAEHRAGCRSETAGADEFANRRQEYSIALNRDRASRGVVGDSRRRSDGSRRGWVERDGGGGGGGA